MQTNEVPVVLLVEDDPVGISSLAGILGSAYELIICQTLGEARQLLTHETDLILLDLYLPDGSGIDFLDYLRNLPDFDSLPVMCISSSDQISDIEQAFQHGATDYVLKPFNPTIVSAKIATLIDLKRKTDLLATAAMTDPLTGIGNRRLFDQQLEIEWRRAKRHGGFVGLILIDLDHFKQINDSLGHGAGDEVLRRLAHSIQSRFVRAGDVCARIGGDEFAVITPGTDPTGTILAASDLLKSIQQPRQKADSNQISPPHYTISMGCWALEPSLADNQTELMEHADRHLYQAKREGGRNCVRPLITDF